MSPSVPRASRWAAALLLAAASNPSAAVPHRPSFDCSQVAAGGVPALVCANDDLARLDRLLAATYQQASRKAARQQRPMLRAEQRDWIGSRDDCLTHSDVQRCVANAYRRRTAELQARYRLVEGKGPVRYVCPGDPGREVIATFYPTDPETVVAERGAEVLVMVRAPAASGARYVGREASLWEHQSEAAIRWGHGQPERRCMRATAHSAEMPPVMLIA